MQGSDFDEDEFFRVISACGARALLIGRRAVIALGVPVMTSDYDFWVHPDDIGLLNAACARFDLVPNKTPEEARRVGRYVLENDEHVDVLVARAVFTVDGEKVVFDELWERRIRVGEAPGPEVAIPSVPDLIATKRFALRPKDLEDIRNLRVLFNLGDEGQG